MIKKLTAHGNSAALVIDKPIMELLHITIDTSLDISTDGKILILSPITEPTRKQAFNAALKRVISKHGKTFAKLAKHEFVHALRDGLGKASAAEHEPFLWSIEPPMALAHARGSKTLYLLIQEGRDPSKMTPKEYLNLAGKISAEFNAFVVPDQKTSGHILWGGKNLGPVCVYRFRILEEPIHGFKPLIIVG